MKLVFIAVTLLTNFTLIAQNNDETFSRLRGISNNGTEFYNIDGISITRESYTNVLSDEGLKKPFRKYSIKKDDAKTRDTALSFNNYYILKIEKLSDTTSRYISYYFIEDKERWLTILTFTSAKKPDRIFEENFVNLIYNNRIPKDIFTPIQIDSIDFVGRKIALGPRCHWMGVNNIQCTYYGQMSWSIHKELSDAQNTINKELELAKLKKGGKVVSETEVDIIIEDMPTKAKKVIYDFTGLTSLLVGMTGGKTLTIYYVATEVRNHFVSCVLSFWNNDNITPTGLTPLLNEVMKLKNSNTLLLN